MHSGQGATLPRRRSRIPTATGGARHQAAARQGAEAELGTDSVDERLETLLHLLGGSFGRWPGLAKGVLFHRILNLKTPG